MLIILNANGLGRFLPPIKPNKTGPKRARKEPTRPLPYPPKGGLGGGDGSVRSVRAPSRLFGLTRMKKNKTGKNEAEIDRTFETQQGANPMNCPICLSRMKIDRTNEGYGRCSSDKCPMAWVGFSLSRVEWARERIAEQVAAAVWPLVLAIEGILAGKVRMSDARKLAREARDRWIDPATIAQDAPEGQPAPEAGKKPEGDSRAATTPGNGIQTDLNETKGTK